MGVFSALDLRNYSILDSSIRSMIDHIIEKTSDFIFVTFIWYLLILILRFVFCEEDTCKDAHDAILPSKHGAISNEEKREHMVLNIDLFCAVIRLLYAKNVYKTNAIVESDATHETDIVLLLFVASKKKFFNVYTQMNYFYFILEQCVYILFMMDI